MEKIKKRIISILLVATMFSITIFHTIVTQAAGKMAFSVGTNFGFFQIDTSSDATNARDLYAIAGYNSYSSTEPTVSIMKGKFKNGIKRMKSDILFFSGHGNFNNVCFNYNGKGGEYATGVWHTTDYITTDNYEMVGISGNMSSVKLITFAACLTASNNDNNITANAVGYGADTAVGWSSEVNSLAHSDLLARYNDKLATGSTVLEAVTYANSFFYIDARVKDARIYGNRSLKIKPASRTSFLGENNDMKNIISLPYATKMDDKITKDSIVKVACENIQNFDSDDYEVDIHEICDNCYTVDFIFTINGVRTNSFYTMTIIDGNMVEIVDNTISFDKTKLKLNAVQFNFDSDVEIMKTARNITNSSSLKTATKQEIMYYYDIKNNSFQKVVFTVYQFDSTDAVGKDMFIEKIS